MYSDGWVLRGLNPLKKGRQYYRWFSYVNLSPLLQLTTNKGVSNILNDCELNFQPCEL